MTAPTCASPTCWSSSSSGPVDAILSTATFHWIADHERLFTRLRGVLVPGGRLVAQCGGAGNVAALDAAARRVGEREPFAPALAGWSGPWNFASPAETEERLRRLGWVDVWTWSYGVRVEPEDPREYLGTVALGSHTERLEPGLRDAVRGRRDRRVGRAGRGLRAPQHPGAGSS